MRNTSKLKLILAKYDVALSMTEEDLMTLSLVDKDSGRDVHFQHKTYSWLVSKAYSHLLKSVKLPSKTPAPPPALIPGLRMAGQLMGSYD